MHSRSGPLLLVHGFCATLADEGAGCQSGQAQPQPLGSAGRMRNAIQRKPGVRAKGHIPSRRGLLLAGSVGIGATLGLAGTAEAATFQVSTLSDAGPGSLRDAITQANAQSGADTISFQSGLSGTIRVASDLPVITEAVGIAGPGAGQLAVFGNYSYALFDADLAAPGGPVTISGLHVDGGAQNGSGANIDNRNAN